MHYVIRICPETESPELFGPFFTGEGAEYWAIEMQAILKGRFHILEADDPWNLAAAIVETRKDYGSFKNKMALIQRLF